MKYYGITRKCIRLKNHDYTSEGMYYITICTEGRQYLLGHKENDHIELSPIGQLVEESWRKIRTMYDGVDIDEYSIMPTHIHGIIVYK